jgi:hypothetical protein
MECLRAFGCILISAKNDGPLFSPTNVIGRAKLQGAEGGLHG